MKNIIFILTILASHSCTAQINLPVTKAYSSSIDNRNFDTTIFFPPNNGGLCAECADLVWHGGFELNNTRIEPFINYYDSFAIARKKVDSLQQLLILARFRLNRLVKYDKIVIAKPSQLKWLKGWMNRALQ